MAISSLCRKSPHTRIHAADMLAYLAAAAQMQPVPGFTLQQAKGRYGNALLTRLPLSAVNRYDISIPGREARGLIEARFQCQKLQCMVWATHLGLGVRERHRQINRLLQIVDGADADLGMLLGDLNEWLVWSRCLRALRQRFTAPPITGNFSRLATAAEAGSNLDRQSRYEDDPAGPQNSNQRGCFGSSSAGCRYNPLTPVDGK